VKPSSNNKQIYKKEAVLNSSGFQFEWKLGNAVTNVVLENKELDVRINRYLITSSSGEVIYDGLGFEESKNNTVALIRNQNLELGLIWEWRPIPGKYFWACVRGFGDPKDEDNIATAKREMIEEVGKCRVVSSQRVGSLYQNTTYFENPVGLVLIDVSENKGTHYIVNNKENIFKFYFFSENKILEMIKNGEIEDTFTLSALMKYFALIH
jgi:hypothetical protein